MYWWRKETKETEPVEEKVSFYLIVDMVGGKRYYWNSPDKESFQKFFEWFYNPTGPATFKLSFEDSGRKNQNQIIIRSQISTIIFGDE